MLAKIVYWWRHGRWPPVRPVGLCARCAEFRPVIVSTALRPVCLDCAEWHEV